MTADANKIESSDKFYNLEFPRIIFVVCAILVHVNPAAIQTVFPNFIRMNQIVVDLMFILGGFLMYEGIKKRQLPLLVFAKKKYVRLAPPVVATTAILVIFKHAEVSHAVMDSLFIPNLDYNTIRNLNGVGWYVPAYFSAIIALYFLLTNFERKKVLFFIAAASYAIFCWRYMNGRLATYGSLRGFAAMGIGVLISHFVGIVGRGQRKVEWTLAEFFAIASIFQYLGKGYALKESLYITVYFCIILFSFATCRGYLSEFLNKQKWVCRISRYTYSAYLFQGVFFIFFARYFPINLTLVVAAIGISFLLAVLFDSIWDKIYALWQRKKYTLRFVWRENDRANT